MSKSLAEVVEALKGAKVEDVHALKEILNAVDTRPQGAPVAAPTDVVHLWSDNRKDHAGRAVPRSCIVTGVVASVTNEAHGRMATAAEEAAHGVTPSEKKAPEKALEKK